MHLIRRSIQSLAHEGADYIGGVDLGEALFLARADEGTVSEAGELLDAGRMRGLPTPEADLCRDRTMLLAFRPLR